MQLFTMGIGRSTMPLSGAGSGFRSAPSAKTECDLRYFRAHHSVAAPARGNEPESRKPSPSRQTTERPYRSFLRCGGRNNASISPCKAIVHFCSYAEIES
jgi:hypothetical protein